MGFEVEYQAIPGDGRLVELARSDVEDGWGLSRIGSWLRRPDPTATRRLTNRIRDAAEALVAADPAFLAVHCELDRTWDTLHYLLSATRRGLPATDTDRLIDRAFDDGDDGLIAEHLRCSQGFPILYLSTAIVVDVAAVLDMMSPSDLATHYHPERMEAHGVYKFWADRVPADTMAPWISAYFTRLKQFFIAAAAGDFGVVRHKD